MLAKELGLVVMDLYLEPKLTLTFDLVVMLRAYKWNLWFPYIHVKTFLEMLLMKPSLDKHASVRYNRTLAI